MIKLQCECGRRINAPDQYLGKRVKCPKCGRPLVVGGPRERDESRETEAQRAPAEVAAAPASMPASDLGQGPAITDSMDTPSSEPGEESRPDAIDAGYPDASESEASGEVAAPAVQSEVVAAPQAHAGQTEPGRRRRANLLGLLAIVAGLAAAGMFFVPATARYFMAAAGAAVALGLLGLVVAIARRRAGFLSPVLGVLVGLAAFALPWIPGLHAASDGRPTDARRRFDTPPADEAKAAAEEARRRSFIAVTMLEPTGNNDSIVPELEYRLTNKTGKAIKELEGKIQLYDTGHVWLTSLGIGIDQPLAAGGVSHGKGNWPLDSHTLTLVKDRRLITEFRADRILYADGTTERIEN